MKKAKLFQLLLITLLVTSISCGEQEEITVFDDGKTIEDSQLSETTKSAGARVQSRTNCTLNGITGIDYVAPGTAKTYYYNLNIAGQSVTGKILNWTIVSGSDFTISRTTDFAITIFFGEDFCEGEIVVRGQQVGGTNTNCDVNLTIEALPEPPCEIDPITPTFFVDVNTDLEVCPGDIFEAYATENVGEGFYRHEWIFPSNVMQLAPGYSKYQSHVEFEATGGAGSAMHIQLNAYYRCVSVDRCTGAVTRRSAVRTSTIWGGNIQNCSGSGPKI